MKHNLTSDNSDEFLFCSVCKELVKKNYFWYHKLSAKHVKNTSGCFDTQKEFADNENENENNNNNNESDENSDNGEFDSPPSMEDFLFRKFVLEEMGKLSENSIQKLLDILHNNFDIKKLSKSVYHLKKVDKHFNPLKVKEKLLSSGKTLYYLDFEDVLTKISSE